MDEGDGSAIVRARRSVVASLSIKPNSLEAMSQVKTAPCCQHVCDFRYADDMPPQAADSRERSGDLVEARRAGVLDEHHIARGEMAAKPFKREVENRGGTAPGRPDGRQAFRRQRTAFPGVSGRCPVILTKSGVPGKLARATCALATACPGQEVCELLCVGLRVVPIAVVCPVVERRAHQGKHWSPGSGMG
jgi:hypothetical protein